MNDIEKEGMKKMIETFQTISLSTNDCMSSFRTIMINKKLDWISYNIDRFEKLINAMSEVEKGAISIVKDLEKWVSL